MIQNLNFDKCLNDIVDPEMRKTNIIEFLQAVLTTVRSNMEYVNDYNFNLWLNYAMKPSSMGLEFLLNSVITETSGIYILDADTFNNVAYRYFLYEYNGDQKYQYYLSEGVTDIYQYYLSEIPSYVGFYVYIPTGLEASIKADISNIVNRLRLYSVKWEFKEY